MYELLQKLAQLAHGSQTYNLSQTVLLPPIRVAISSHNKPRDSTAGESSKTFKIVNADCRFFRRHCLIDGGHGDGVFL